MEPARPRQWQVDLYYPAASAQGAELGWYAPDPALLEAMKSDSYYQVPARELDQWLTRRAPALQGAAAAKQAPRPLITFSPGFGVAAFNYSLLAAELVRRGFAVAVIDHPYLGISRLPGGRVVRSSEDPMLRNENQETWAPRIADWARDVSVTLDRLAEGKGSVEDLSLDLEHVTAAGHSLGGAIALDACIADSRVSACADFEGAPFGTVTAQKGPTKPALFVLSRSGKPERPPVDPQLDDPMFAFLTKAGSPSSWAVGVTGGSHMSFSDAPFVMPQTLSMFGGTVMSAERSLEVYAGMISAFASAYRPGGGGDAAFEAHLKTIPEARGHQSARDGTAIGEAAAPPPVSAAVAPGPAEDATSYLPRWSPDGERLVFFHRQHGRWSIHSVAADGGDLRRLTDGSRNERHPSWSPDGKQIVFDAEWEGNRELAVMNADGSGMRRVTRHPAEDTMPAWSPDGRSLAFVSDRGGAVEVWLTDLDGRGARPLTTDSVFNDVPRPAWSPDGRTIAFASSRERAAANPERRRQLFLVRPDGSGLRAIVRPGYPGNQRWSPDGRRLVFDAHPHGVDDSSRGEWELFVVGADGGGLRRLTHDDINEWAPDWSPDGARLAYCAGADDRYEVWTMRVDGSDRRRVTRLLPATAPAGSEGGGR